MAMVTYRARRGDGPEQRGQLDARTLDEATRILEARGFDSIVYETEPVVPDLDGRARQERWVAPRSKTPWRSFVRAFASHWLLWGIVAWGFWWARGSSVRLGVASLVAAAAIVYVSILALPILVFARLQHAKAWAKWREGLACVALLRFANLFVRNPTLAWSYDYEEARLRAGQGELDRALGLVAKHEGTTAESRHRHAGQLVGIYGYAKRRDLALKLARERTEARPDDASAWLDLAMQLALRSRDAKAAREAIVHAEGKTVSELASAFGAVVWGAIHLLEGAPRAALEELDTAAAHFATSGTGTEGMRGLVDVLRARALAGVGEIDAARTTLDGCQSMLRAAGDGELVEEAETAIRHAGGTPR
jgi:tetratricopeptide (TPR) repeat protein